MTPTPVPPIGPNQLTDLEYEIYLMIERRPRPAEPEALLASVGVMDPGASAPGEALPLWTSRREVERATGELERQGYIERINLAEHGEHFRLTPWGKAALVSFRDKSARDLSESRRQGFARADREPKLSTTVIELTPWDIGPSFDELDLKYLELPPRVRDALRRSGIKTLGRVTGLTAGELFDLKGIGPKAMATIEARLDSLALTLAVARPAEDAGDTFEDGEARMDPCWEDKPYSYQLYVQSGGLFDRSPEYKKERVFWTGPLMELACALDTLGASGQLGREEVRPLELAFDTLIVLVEPGWWRQHSPRELSPGEDRRLFGLRGDYDPRESDGSTFLRAIAKGPEATWQSLEGLVTAAVETFVRARAADGLWRCARLMGVMPAIGNRHTSVPRRRRDEPTC